MLLRVLIVWNWTRVTLALWNAAKWKPTYQSTSWPFPYLTRVAVDGSNNQYLFRKPYCAHTAKGDSQPWWMVDLQGQYLVKKITVTNRVDCCSARLKNFRIEFFDSDPRLLSGFPHVRGSTCYIHGTSYLKPGDHSFNCAEGTKGRFGMLVFQEGYMEPLTLCEFKAFVETEQSKSIPYKGISGARATVSPFLTLSSTSKLSCAVECNNRRDQELCTAFNWNQDLLECRLLNSNPYGAINQVSEAGWDLYRVFTV